MQLPQEELKARVAAFQKDLQKSALEAALIIQRLDLYYFTGTTYLQYLIVPAAGEPVALARQEVPEPIPWRIAYIARSNELAAFLREIVGPEGQIGLELDVLPVNHYLRLAQALPAYRLADASPIIRRRRAVKTAWEVGVLREAAEKDLAVWTAVPELLTQARTDLELAAGIEALARRQGHQGLLKFRAFNEDIYFNSVLAGPAGAWAGPWDTPLSGRGVSPTFPQGASGAPLRPGEPILIDYGGCYQGYILDQTRLFALGHLPQEFRRLYDAARQIQDAVVAAARPGVACGRLYEIAANLAAEAGLADLFMGPKRVPYIGHGVGLELDEWPVLAKGSTVSLEPGMVFALEPKFVLPGRGAVGLENCFVVTDDGVERLTLATDELIIV